jgi:hypothetical protein
MNTDYGFFHLFKALKSLQNNKPESALPESRAQVELKLPQIDYSLLTSQPVSEQRCQQQRSLRWDRFGWQAATTAGH